MNKEEMLKLAEDIDADFYPSTEESLIIFTNDQLLTFANACEKIGMEKAAKTCDEVMEPLVAKTIRDAMLEQYK